MKTLIFLSAIFALTASAAIKFPQEWVDWKTVSACSYLPLNIRQ